MARPFLGFAKMVGYFLSCTARQQTHCTVELISFHTRIKLVMVLYHTQITTLLVTLNVAAVLDVKKVVACRIETNVCILHFPQFSQMKQKLP
jgi:hypothetical protein